MAKYVWCTIGTSPREMREAKAVIVEADDLDAAREKVLADACFDEDPVEEATLRTAMFASYGLEWFLQELADGEL